MSVYIAIFYPTNSRIFSRFLHHQFSNKQGKKHFAGLRGDKVTWHSFVGSELTMMVSWLVKQLEILVNLYHLTSDKLPVFSIFPTGRSGQLRYARGRESKASSMYLYLCFCVLPRALPIWSYFDSLITVPIFVSATHSVGGFKHRHFPYGGHFRCIKWKRPCKVYSSHKGKLTLILKLNWYLFFF